MENCWSFRGFSYIYILIIIIIIIDGEPKIGLSPVRPSCRPRLEGRPFDILNVQNCNRDST